MGARVLLGLSVDVQNYFFCCLFKINYEITPLEKQYLD